MVTVRGVGAAALTALLFVLTGCVAAPQVDLEALTERMVEALPHGLGDGFTVSEGDALDYDVDQEVGGDFGGDRLAGVYREFESPGWTDHTQGPAFWASFAIVRFRDAGEADRYLQRHRDAAGEEITVERTGDTPTTIASASSTVLHDYLPVDAVDRPVRYVWEIGQRATGWSAWFVAGATAGTVSFTAVPVPASIAAAEAAAEQHVADFVENVFELESIELEFADPDPVEAPRQANRAEAERLMWETLPERVGDGFEIEEGDAAAAVTLTLEGSIDDHDAHSVVGAYRVFTSPGWYETDVVAAYWFAIDVILMDSERAADAFVHEVSLGWGESYTLTDEFDSTTYSPNVVPARSFFPLGTVERTTEVAWNSGLNGSGLTAWMTAGPFVGIVSTEFVSGSESYAAEIDVFLEEWASEFRELPERLAAAG